ncbi:MAG: hypothetical protein QXK06_00140 [Candidatus Diapherotrites archaeon]
MESIIADRLKKSHSHFIEYFNIWKSRLVPEKKHWILAVIYFALLLLFLSLVFLASLFFYTNLFNDPFFLEWRPLFMLVFDLLFYFFAFRWLEVKRLSEFLPVASAIFVINTAFLIGFYIFAYPVADISGGLAGLLVAVITESVFSYFVFVFHGLGAMAVFLRKFEKGFLLCCLLLALFAFLINPMVEDFVYGTYAFLFTDSTYPKYFIAYLLSNPVAGLYSLVLKFAQSSTWISITKLFLFFSFILHFERKKEPFLLVLAVLFAQPLTKLLFYSLQDQMQAFMMMILYLKDLALTLSFAIIFIFYCVFLKFREEPD